MKAGTLLLILNDVTNYLIQVGLLLPDGELVQPTLEQDLAIAQAIEHSLNNHGVKLDDKLNRIIEVLPLVLKLVK